MSKYNVIADKIVNEVLENSQRIIGITGTSCVGKSTLTNILKSKIERTYSVTVIDVDSYLKEEIRGGKNFWNRCSEYLMPAYFEWRALEEDIGKLNKGEYVKKQVYKRGIGWSGEIIYRPADYYIVEGLFLDSIEAAEYVNYDRMIVLSASDEYIYHLRVQRNEYYRQNFKDFTRTKEETVEEIKKTLKAGKAYCVSGGKWPYTKIHVQEDLCTEVTGE